MKKFMLPAAVLLSIVVASHSCTSGNTDQLEESYEACTDLADSIRIKYNYAEAKWIGVAQTIVFIEDLEERQKIEQLADSFFQIQHQLSTRLRSINDSCHNIICHNESQNR